MLHAISSAILLILAFPSFSWFWTAWFAFVPIFFLSLSFKRARVAFFNYYLFGFLFFLTSVEWLRYVAYVGWFFVSFLYAIFFGLFGLFVYRLWKRKAYMTSLFVLPSVWVTLEWVRTEMPIWAFGWNLLAYSQSEQIEIASLASLTGAFGVSWLILFVNLAIFFVINTIPLGGEKHNSTSLRGRQPNVVEAIKQYRVPLNASSRSSLLAMTTASVAIVAFLCFAYYELNLIPTYSNNELARVAVVQGNIPQHQKWDPKKRKDILRTYEELTRIVNRDEPDLVVWPEASFPGYFNVDALSERVVRLHKSLRIPIAVGSPSLAAGGYFFNSAFLVEDGKMNQRYDKVRLVPFGEFVPWKPIFFGVFGLRKLAHSMGVGDYRAGKDIEVFRLKDKFQFSPLICFEDTFPSLARRAVASGAQFLVVMTNDAWFSDSAAPYQHVQASTFRAIENGVSVVRAANTGISGFITARGELKDKIQNTLGHDLFVMGGLVRGIDVSRQGTWYQKGGHWFSLVCLLVVLISTFTFRSKEVTA